VYTLVHVIKKLLNKVEVRMSKHDIPTYYGAEWSWIIYYLNQIVRTAEKFFLVCECYQNEHYVYTDSDGLKNDKH